MEPFVESRQDDAPVLFGIDSWSKLNPKLSVGFSSRLGGVSTGEWDSLNCALHVNDNPQHVITNRQLVADTIGFPLEAWTCSEQVHGNKVHRVTNEDRGKGCFSRESALQGIDAMITNEPGLWLTSFYADCVPLYFYDPSNSAIGLAHAGWKGTVSTIAKITIRRMIDELGCQVESLRTAIGPSIGACCYEVDEPVIRQFRSANMTRGIQEKGNGRYWLDLKEINRQIMIEAGILQSHIEITRLCTSCHVKQFYSHRKERGKTGRMMSWIGMKER